MDDGWTGGWPDGCMHGERGRSIDRWRGRKRKVDDDIGKLFIKTFSL